MPWPERPGDRVDMVILAVADASHGDEYDVFEDPAGMTDDWLVREPFRSQGVRLVCVCWVWRCSGQGVCKSALGFIREYGFEACCEQHDQGRDVQIVGGV